MITAYSQTSVHKLVCAEAVA